MAGPVSSSAHACRRLLLPLLLGLGAAGTAHGTYLDFEDLPPLPGNEYLDGYPVTDQYADLGVTFSGAYLVHWIPDAYLLGDVGVRDMSLRFTGTLPTHVSFELGAGRNISVRWRGITGRGENIELEPQAPPGPVSFSSQAGIALVKITWADLEKAPWHVSLDNLHFGNVPAVPEPAPIALAGVGVLLLGWRRWRERRVGKKCAGR